MTQIRTAVIGAGRLGGFHAQKLAAHERVDLVGVVDPVAENRQRVAAECHTEAVHDHRQLFGKIDAAVIAAPTKLHHPLAKELLERGIHVLVEKPVCSTVAEADDLLRTAERCRVVFQVGHVERFNPAFAAATANTPDPKYIEAVRAGGFTFRSTDVGVVLDLMIHDIDLVLSLVRSPVRRIDALGFSVLGGHEDVANARIHFESGCVAHLSASRVSYAPARRMHVWSEQCFAGIDFATRSATLVKPSETLRRREFDVDLFSPEQIEHGKKHFAEEHLPCERMEFEAIDALAAETDDFVDSIVTPRSPRVSGAAGREALAVAEHILARIETHAWDDNPDGPVGPLAIPRTRIIPAPHFTLAPSETPAVHREAG